MSSVNQSGSNVEVEIGFSVCFKLMPQQGRLPEPYPIATGWDSHCRF